MASEFQRRRGEPGKLVFANVVWLVLFGLIIVALLWLAVLRELDRDRRDHEAALEQNLDSFARALEGHLGAAVRAIDASLILLRNEYGAHGGRVKRQADLLNEALLDQGVAQIAIIGPDGFLAYSNRSTGRAPLYLGDREHFRFHLQATGDQLYVSKPVLGRVSQQWTLQFTRKILRADGSFGGVIVVSVAPEYFGAFYDSVFLGAQGSVTLAGTDRVIRARSARGKEALGQELVDFPAFDEDAGPRGHFHARSPIDHVERLYSYRQLRDLPLMVIVGVAEQEAFAGLAHQRREYLGAAAVGTLAIAVVIGLLLVQIRRQSEAAARYHHLMQHASDGMVVCDGHGVIHDVNAETCRSLGYPAEELLGRPYADIDQAVGPDDLGTLFKGAASAAGGVTRDGLLQRKDGSRCPAEVKFSRVPGPETLILGLVRDVTERRQMEALMWRQANFDVLTGLPNRALFQDRLSLAIAQAKRRANRLILMFLDLDHFKEVNDVLGHHAGDELLKRWLAGCRPACGRRTPWHAWAATSSA